MPEITTLPDGVRPEDLLPYDCSPFRAPTGPGTARSGGLKSLRDQLVRDSLCQADS